MRSGSCEIEVKIRIDDVRAASRSLRRAGFECVRRRTFESNMLYDDAARSLARGGCALRLRTYGPQSTLTYKGPRLNVPGVKAREEIEFDVPDAGAASRLLERLGFSPCFRYEKYRTVFTRGRLTAVLDRTPIGDFLELEGSRAAILRTARHLGFQPPDLMRESYVELFLNDHTGDMVFPKGSR